MSDFVVGQTYTRQKLHDQYGGQRFGGISTPARFPYVFLFTGEEGKQYGYTDGPHPDGSFWYTGEGRKGDMKWNACNRAILEQQVTGKELHLFESSAKRQVQYIGRAEYIRHHEEIIPDEDGQLRIGFVFELALDSDPVGTPAVEPEDLPSAPPLLWRLNLSKLRAVALGDSNRKLILNGKRSKTYYRSEAVKVYVLRRANGVCEGCGNEAPFTTRKGTLYLEPHHIRRRADAGPDHPAWVAALCPNCHRRAHYSVDGREFNAFLRARLLEIEPDDWQETS
jgi:5-methylcytosine-specific restriction enzyme A